MSATFKCDGCGTEVQTKRSMKPHDWFEREDSDGVQHACSRSCIESVASKSGKTNLVLPI
jgi:hypothetical protein